MDNFPGVDFAVEFRKEVPPADACTLAGKVRTARVCLEPGKLTGAPK
jgi:hypothetical protein